MDNKNQLLRWILAVRNIFNLRIESDEQGTIENIRKNVDFHGANAWTLVFAIFIASIGLNMNSAAVIIGAMLISPLMGPILGIGLSLGINDELLLRKSFRNLSIAVLISVTTSMVYFILSPIHEAQSELLARTYPTFYDVLIAFFGGAAGIVSISRKERGPSVAGVAIATALMPPLCTAGYALSTGNLKFLAGALYLFSINSVFIAVSTFLFVRYMRFQIVQVQEHDHKLKLRRWLGAIVISMIVPSLVFAWTLLQESKFKQQAERFLKQEFHSKTAFVVNKDLNYSYRQPIIQIDVIGNPMTTDEVENLEHKLAYYDLGNAKLKIRQIDPNDNSKEVHSPLELEITALKNKVRSGEDRENLLKQLTLESQALFPQVFKVIDLSDQLGIFWQRPPKKKDIEKLNAFLKVRDQRTKEPPLHFSIVK